VRLIVTRPSAQARTLVQELTALGLDAVALPLIGIEPLAPRDVQALRHAWATLAEQRLVTFVSANAVEHFFAAAPASAAPTAAMTPAALIATAAAAWPLGTWAGSTGPGTTAALRAAHVPPACIKAPAEDAPQHDSEALWQALRGEHWAGARVLIVRGEGGGREWLSDTLRAAGAQVEQLAAYRRTLPAWGAIDTAVLAAADADPGAHVWHFGSSEAVHNLERMAPAGRWRASTACVTHPRIAQAACAAGFSEVRVLAAGSAALARIYRAAA
jgi:uroporphyrinogen-III synthase